MELNEIITLGLQRTDGNVAELARLIGTSRETLSRAKSHKQPLTLEACARLAQHVGIDAIEVIAANRRATATKEEDREFWKIFGKAASIAAVGIVTTFVTPSPVQAHQTEASQNHDLYYGKSATPAASKKRQLIRAMKQAIERVIVRIAATFKPWIAQPQAI